MITDDDPRIPGVPAPSDEAGVRPARRWLLGAWAFGVLALATVVAVVVQRSELAEIGRVVRGVRPLWLVAAGALQAGTYVCAAAVWRVALTRAGYPCSTRALVPLALGMLFTNQAIPSAGLSGSAFVLGALGRRGVPKEAAMAALLTGLVTTYIAYVLAIGASILLLAAGQVVTPGVLLVAGAFALMSVAVPSGILWYARSAASPRARARLSRVPGLGPVLAAVAAAPNSVLRDPRLLRGAVAWQLAELALDAATLQIMLLAIGVPAAPASVFASFVMAYAVSRVGPTPLGLGTFEGSSIAMLHLTGVPIEAALTATLLLRAFTLWLPMLPGLFCARLVLSARAAPAARA